MLGNYTSPWMTEDLTIFEDAASKFMTNEFVPLADKWAKQGIVDREAWTKAGEAGLLCTSIPEEYGGGGGDYRHEAILTEVQTRLGVGGWGQSVHSLICSHYFLAYGTEEQKKKYLPKMASGEMVCAIAMTEPGTGSDLQSVKTTALKDGNQYLVNGSKTFITNGQTCDMVLVVAKTDTSQGAKGISLVIVETGDDTQGFARGRNLDKMGQHAADTSELFFDDVKVPADNILGGEEGQGFYQLMQQLPAERLVIANQAVASMERAIALTLDYTRERKTFGNSIFDYQNTQYKLAECKATWMAARAMVDQLLAQLLEGKLDANSAAAAKFWCTERENEVIDDCLQFFGGYGYMDEYPISRMYTDARVQRIYGGSNEIMRMLVARAL
ncbi:MAG: acyl-CoA dehydrogenase [Rhodobiaceae bacterium]|jgi:acyl-CoA dehydrogenase|nr:acyl-CoA dehydrogenase [Rhodobiaceae bacterium]MBT5518468.1 acyl-CoA dehydrogenase [Rhodobiaceae bacterium]MDG2495838.1 acyl-CoA dehydrogenase family protein [Alphaproteobacteria bacterium]